MNVDKVILNCFLSTLAAVATLLFSMAMVLCIFFPSTMMGITYNLGMENSSIHFAERAYKSKENIYFISYATEVAIEEDNREKIISCGQTFLNNGEFNEFCAKKGGNYEQYIVGEVCLAKYENGDKENAVNDAFHRLNGSFPQNNAVVSLLFTAIKANDKDTVSSIVEKLDELTVESDDLLDAKKWGKDFLAK